MSTHLPLDVRPAARLRNDGILVQAVRYGFVGLIAFAVDFMVLVLLTEHAGLHYAHGAVWGFVAGLTTNYLLCIAWVFHERALSDRKLEFAIFAAIGAAGLLLTEAILWLGTEQLEFDYRLSKIAAVAIVLVWNFSARKCLLFRGRRLAE